MSTVMDPGEGAMMARGRREKALPARLTTTLYALLAALQDVVGPDNDPLVVATAVHLLRSGRLTPLRKASTCRRMTPWEHFALLPACR
jgi:hypothetical protein